MQDINKWEEETEKIRRAVFMRPGSLRTAEEIWEETERELKNLIASRLEEIKGRIESLKMEEFGAVENSDQKEYKKKMEVHNAALDKALEIIEELC
jgi:hypothetical protein